jgi:Fe-S-cluster containining protein
LQISRIQFRYKQAAGKFRRFVRANIYTQENETLLSRREGECTRCGACCKILFKCPFLIEEPSAEAGAAVNYKCGIYGDHFNQCRIYPLVPQDLEEVEEPCGYTFK